jgi:hypothetical protein
MRFNLKEKLVEAKKRFVVDLIMIMRVFKSLAIASIILGFSAGASAGTEIASADHAALLAHLRQLDRSSGYQCFRNISNYEDQEFLSLVLSQRHHYREQATGEIYADAYLTSTLPPSRLGVPASAKLVKVSEQEFVLEYERDTTVIGQVKEISDAVHSFSRPGTVKHVFRLENGGLQWVRASYDVRPWHGQNGAARPHVRCSRIVTVKGRFWGTNSVLEPLADIRLGAGNCRSSRQVCAQEVLEPRYL